MQRLRRYLRPVPGFCLPTGIREAAPRAPHAAARQRWPRGQIAGRIAARWRRMREQPGLKMASSGERFQLPAPAARLPSEPRSFNEVKAESAEDDAELHAIPGEANGKAL